MDAWKLCHQSLERFVRSWWTINTSTSTCRLQLWFVCDLEQICVWLSEKERERRVYECVWLEVQYCAQIISDYSHVCNLSGNVWINKNQKAGSPGVIKQIWLDSYEKQGDFTERWWFTTFIPCLCLPPATNTKLYSTASFFPQLTWILSILFVPQWVLHTMFNPLCSLGLHMIFFFTVSALSIMHWTHT